MTFSWQGSPYHRDFISQILFAGYFGLPEYPRKVEPTYLSESARKLTAIFLEKSGG